MKRSKTIRRRPTLASGIPVYCNFDVIDHAEGLRPHPDNAHRGHPAKQLDAYELVIAGNPAKKKKGNGWRKSIVVSLLSGCDPADLEKLIKQAIDEGEFR